MIRSTATLALAFASSLLVRAADDSILGALRIASLDDLAATAAAFADNVQPGAGAATAQLTAAAAMFGIDTSSEILVLVLDPQKTPVPLALVVPVVDPAATKANPAFGFTLATTEGRYQVTLSGRPMFAAFAQNRLVVSPAEQGLDLALPVVETGDDIRQLRATGGQIGLSLDTDRLYTAYKPLIDLMLSPAFWHENGVSMTGVSAAQPSSPLVVSMFWMTLLGEGLIEAGRMAEAAHIARRALAVTARSLEQDGLFHEYYHADGVG
ncbi:MAG: hypothetical protein IAE82_00395, partial [Opitutaceae bacterium]|nr:hypothetical protein [Opitutaceae bacterium]